MTTPATDLATLTSDGRVVLAMTAASLAVFIYDYFETLPMELKYVWPTNWTVIKIVFLTTRYLPFIDMTAFTAFVAVDTFQGEICFRWLLWLITSYTIGLSLMDVILALRTWIMWDSSKSWGIGLCILVAAFLAMITWATVLVVEGLTGITPKASCKTIGFGNPVWPVYTAKASFEAIILIATLVRSMHYFGRRRERVLNVLYRDALMYTSFTFILSVLVVMSTSAFRPSLTYVLISVDRAASTILGCRVILHLRHANAVASSNGLTTTVDIDGFGPPTDLTLELEERRKRYEEDF